MTVRVENPRLWWPVGHGEQAFYDLAVSLAGQRRDFRIGLRSVALLTNADEIVRRLPTASNSRGFMIHADIETIYVMIERATTP